MLHPIVIMARMLAADTFVLILIIVQDPVFFFTGMPRALVSRDVGRRIVRVFGASALQVFAFIVTEVQVGAVGLRTTMCHSIVVPARVCTAHAFLLHGIIIQDRVL